VSKRLEESNLSFLNKINDLILEEVGQWKELAKKWICETDKKIETLANDDDELDIIELEVAQIQCDSQNNIDTRDDRLKSRPGLGKPAEKEHKSILTEMLQYDTLNDDDIREHNDYCDKKNIVIHKRTAEFWRRHEETFPRLSIIAKMLNNSAVSSSSLERQFSFTSLMTSICRKSLAASTITNIALSSKIINFDQ